MSEQPEEIDQPIVAEHFDVGTAAQRKPMPTTDPEQPNGYDYEREDGTKIFVQDLGSNNDGSGRNEQAGNYLIFIGGYHDEGPDGDFTAPEPLPYPSALRDLAEQYLTAKVDAR